MCEISLCVYEKSTTFKQINTRKCILYKKYRDIILWNKYDHPDNTSLAHNSVLLRHFVAVAKKVTTGNLIIMYSII